MDVCHVMGKSVFKDFQYFTEDTQSCSELGPENKGKLTKLSLVPSLTNLSQALGKETSEERQASYMLTYYSSPRIVPIVVDQASKI